MPERMIEANGVGLCTEGFGDPADPPILLIAGNGGSMLWWEEASSRPAASATRSPALDFPDRVASLVLISTSAAVPTGRELPIGSDRLAGFLATARVDRSDPGSVVEYLVDYSRVLAGGRRPFDEDAVRELAQQEVARARNLASAQNHELVEDGGGSRPPMSAITAPTLVVHGTADPMFPPAHGEALAEEIPGARLLTIPDAGHGVERADWERLANAILEHTEPA